METPDILAGVSMIISVVSVILVAVNHKRIRSSCCGRRLEASIDIEQTTPPRPPSISVQNSV